MISLWLKGLLTDRKQCVKIGNIKSSWQSISGGVPQGTLSGPEIFIHMINDLTSNITTVKYVDDVTFVEVVEKGGTSQIPEVIANIAAWPNENKLQINVKKTKEILISFTKSAIQVPNLKIDNEEIERVTEAKLLGVNISSDLKWHTHINYMVKKCNQRLHYLRHLKKAGLQQDDLKAVHVALIRPILEYAVQVWSTGLSKKSCDDIEMIQKRACRIILPFVRYSDALQQLNLPSLEQRRTHLCENFFKKMTDPQHRLYDMLSPAVSNNYNLRKKRKFAVPKCRTERYKNSFIPWCLTNLQ
jgi:hypothetical protein